MRKDKILLIGQGAREHAIAKALKKSEIELFAFMKIKNPGIAELSTKIKLANLNDYDTLEAFVKEVTPDIAVIGPEDPLADGIADFLQKKGISVIGPTKKAAQIESSKSFTRELMQKYHIPGLPEFKIFKPNSIKEELLDYITKLGKIVVKQDGLAGGKGVKLMGEHLKTKDEALEFCGEIFEKGQSVILEELLVGEEFSLQCFVSGEDIAFTPIVQDHKRAYEGDSGPNTGGMGSYSDNNHLLPFISKQIVEDAKNIIRQTVQALKKETGKDYLGILYGGFMITPNGLKLLEYNVRFGDPEVMNILPLLKAPLIDIFKMMIKGKLADIQIEFEHKATVCKYFVPEGYPESPKKGQPIKVNIENIKEEGVEMFYSSVNEMDTGEIITSTSRAIAIVGIADNLEQAETKAENASLYIEGPLYHRKDIGTKESIQKRIRHLKELKIL